MLPIVKFIANSDNKIYFQSDMKKEKFPLKNIKNQFTCFDTINKIKIEEYI